MLLYAFLYFSWIFIIFHHKICFYHFNFFFFVCIFVTEYQPRICDPKLSTELYVAQKFQSTNSFPYFNCYFQNQPYLHFILTLTLVLLKATICWVKLACDETYTSKQGVLLFISITIYSNQTKTSKCTRIAKEKNCKS